MSREVMEALRALGASDGGVAGSEALEARVRAAYRARMRRRVVARAVAWSLAAAAMVGIGIGIFASRRAEVKSLPIAARESAAAPVTDAPVDPPVVPRAIGAQPVRRAARYPREVVTEFFPLIDAPPPMDRGEVVRMIVPASAMRRVGLPVNEDRLMDPVKADVLVSEDGLATAIRFVRAE